MDYYVGIRTIQAELEVKDNKEGYSVSLPDGTTTWIAKAEFEESNIKCYDEYEANEVKHRALCDIITRIKHLKNERDFKEAKYNGCGCNCDCNNNESSES